MTTRATRIGRPPVHDHASWLKHYQQGMSDVAIAKASGADHTSVCRWRRNRKLPANFRKGDKLTKQQHEARWSLYDAGLSVREMAERLGVCEVAIRGWHKTRGLKPNPPKSKATRIAA